MKNSWYIISGIAVVVVIAAVAYLYYLSSLPMAPGGNNHVVNNTPTQTSTPTPTPKDNTATSTTPVDPLSATVVYYDSGFSPNIVRVLVGGTVTWINKSSKDFWVASDPHPLHNGYPTTGGCVGSTFDACKRMAPGSSWSFTFDIKGSWGYHNHLDRGEYGMVVVE